MRSECLHQELSQEKQRTLELLGVKEKAEAKEKDEEEEGSEPACRESEDGGELGDMDLVQDLKHIEEQMRLLLREKDLAEEKWVRAIPNEQWSYCMLVHKVHYSTNGAEDVTTSGNVYWSPNNQVIDLQQ